MDTEILKIEEGIIEKKSWPKVAKLPCKNGQNSHTKMQGPDMASGEEEGNCISHLSAGSRQCSMSSIVTSDWGNSHSN